MEQIRNHNNDPWNESKDFKPVLIKEVEISQPLPEISFKDAQGRLEYRRALILVRLHGSPLGTMNLEGSTGGFTSTDLASRIWATFKEKINRHMISDDLGPEARLSTEGLNHNLSPKCLKNRQGLLKKAPLISIILATRDRVQSLSTAFDSLVALDYPEFEIILVDNAPTTNETYDFFAKSQSRLEGTKIHLRYVRENVPGLAVAHNRGLGSARGAITAFTDDDVMVDKNWLAEIWNAFASTDNVGCVTGLVIPLELQTPAQVFFEEFGGFTKGFDRQIYDLNGHHPDNALFPYAAGRFGTGANMAFDTNFLIRAGGFDPALGIGTPTMGADDMAAFFQAIMSGRRLVYQPSALVFHQHRRTYDGLRKQVYGYGAGLTAFLMKCMLDSPKYFTDIVTKIPAGVRYAFSANSTKNQHKSSHYPVELETIERRGMLYGPIAYIISRWKYRKIYRSFSEEKLKQSISLSQHLPSKRLDD